MMRALLIVVAVRRTETGRDRIERSHHSVAIRRHRVDAGRNTCPSMQCRRTRVGRNGHLGEQYRSNQELTDRAAKRTCHRYGPKHLQDGTGTNDSNGIEGYRSTTT